MHSRERFIDSSKGICEYSRSFHVQCQENSSSSQQVVIHCAQSTVHNPRCQQFKDAAHFGPKVVVMSYVQCDMTTALQCPPVPYPYDKPP